MGSTFVRVQLDGKGGVVDSNTPKTDTPPEQLVRAHKNSRLEVMPDGSMRRTELGVRQFNTHYMENGLEGVFATARNSMGSPTDEITPNTILTIGGMPVKASIAERCGLIPKGSIGRRGL